MYVHSVENPLTVNSTWLITHVCTLRSDLIHVTYVKSHFHEKVILKYTFVYILDSGLSHAGFATNHSTRRVS